MLVTRRNQDFMPTLFNELMNWNDTTYSTPRMNIMETNSASLVSPRKMSS